MRKFPLLLLTLLLSLLSATPAAAQSFSGFLRGLSNSLSGGNNQPAPAQNTSATATIGIRGMDDETAANGPARPEDLKLIDGWSATKLEAETAARKRGLVANQAAAYDASASAPDAEVAQ
ncbi:MAG TPA: hypothetical protein VN066_01685 [Rhodocyclaceae bacterium]|jgi:hypothetical protein|nr:hypothetical protein [Rhodocyclaceae bacterium]